MQDVRHVDHLVHERRHTSRLVVRRSDSRVQRRERWELRALCGDIAADLCHDDDDAKLRIRPRNSNHLTHVRALPSHIGSGDENHILAIRTTPAHVIGVRDVLDA